ncbi:MAG TPA: hypothetical protein VL442_05075 [Mucilaginibacter sp.]|jgi:hypothetical protein|nr:hypothetical protein [Mucilaginibacter sp.]
MPLIINNFSDTAKKTEWSWPLRIAVHTHNGLFVKVMAQLDHFSLFTHIHPVAKVQGNGRREKIAGTIAKGKYDILLIIDDGNTHLASFKSIAANYVIVCQQTPADENYTTYKNRHIALINSCLKLFNASGLLFFPVERKPTAVLVWYRSFIKSLAENKSISEAVQATVKNGYLIQIPLAANEHPLEKGYSLIIDRLNKIYAKNYALLGRTNVDKAIRQQFNIIKNTIDSRANLSIKDKMTLASGIVQIYREVDELHQMVKTRQATARPVARISDKPEKFEKAVDVPDIVKEVEQSKTHREIISFSGEPARTAIVSGLDDLVQEVSKPQPLTVQDPRYLQAGISTEQAPGTLLRQYLKPATNYKLSVSVGRLTQGLISADESFPVEDILLDVRTPEEPLTIIFQPTGKGEPQSQTLLLPKLQDSQSVDFDFSTTENGTEFSADIQAAHKNRLIQIVHLSAPVKTDVSDPEQEQITLKTTFSSRRNLDGLGERLEFDLALHYEEQDGQPVVTGVIDKKPVKFNTGGGLQNIVDHIKETIEKAAREPEDHPYDLNDPNNQKLMVKLAISGTQLHNNLIQGQITGDGPLQVVANRAVFVPFDFVYTLPAPKFTATLCDHAQKALASGKCLDCFNKSTEPAEHICPFGFWGFSRIIERFKYNSDEKNDLTSDLLVYSEPATGRNTLEILQNTIHGSSERVNHSDPALRLKISDFLKTASSTSTVETWNDWVIETAAIEPETIILITHIQRNEEFSVDEMEIGGDMLPQVHFGPKYILENKKPFAIVIGCEVDNVNNQGFDVSSEFLNKGAAIVITNFTKISGEEAVKIVIRLVQLLKADCSGGIQLGAVILKLKQQLLAEGLMSSLSLTAYGDADWIVSAGTTKS